MAMGFTLATALIGLIFLALLVARIGTRRWQASTANLFTQLEAERQIISRHAYTPADLEGLPEPVQHYLQAVLPEGQTPITGVSLEHTGSFNISNTGEQWKSFTSRQRVITHRPGFVWAARIRMVPGLTALVHDAYLGGKGLLSAKLLGLLNVVDQPDTPGLALGELMRFLAEAAWYPTVLLPGHGVVWKPIDDTQAEGRLTDGTTTASLTFQFDSQGLISEVYAEARYRDVNGSMVPTPWRGRFWDYERREGILIPLAGEVAWLLDGDSLPYWRARIQHIIYEY